MGPLSLTPGALVVGARRGIISIYLFRFSTFDRRLILQYNLSCNSLWHKLSEYILHVPSLGAQCLVPD